MSLKNERLPSLNWSILLSILFRGDRERVALFIIDEEIFWLPSRIRFDFCCRVFGKSTSEHVPSFSEHPRSFDVNRGISFLECFFLYFVMLPSDESDDSCKMYFLLGL